ncbi:SseB family protein [Amycolatopsis aidingensis]|uniref:SseB family protein n=1 Tax=Amycolatopsis aidingensis TaxID=2842453 RepID=UPI0038CC0480
MVRAARRHPAAFTRAFAEATVYCQRPVSPGVLVSEVSDRGRWVLVFSTRERLGRFAGPCEWQAMSGADLLAQLPDDVGVMLDAQDEHAMPVLPAAVSQEQDSRPTPRTRPSG